MCTKATDNAKKSDMSLVASYRLLVSKPRQGQNAPLARTLSKLARTGKPDGVVSHFIEAAMYAESKPRNRKVEENEYLGELNSY